VIGRTLAIARRELGALLASRSAWAAALVAVLGLHAAFYFLGFPIGDRRVVGFWEGRTASLAALFSWLPFAAAVLAPALTMGAWSAEKKSGTEELLLAHPLRAGEAVLGKFLAHGLVAGALLLCATLPLAVLVSRLGPLDWGASACGLFGALLLAAGYVAVGLCASALVAEELSAFLLASGLLFLLTFAGFFVRALPPELAELAWYASPPVHFVDSAARGLFDARDVLYHALLAAFALTANTLAVSGRRWR
jgi:ABC-2 type transport system permease protein